MAADKIVLGEKAKNGKGLCITIHPKWLKNSIQRRPYQVVLGTKPKPVTRNRVNAIKRGKAEKFAIPIATQEEMAVLLQRFPGLHGRFLISEKEYNEMKKREEEAQKLIDEAFEEEETEEEIEEEQEEEEDPNNTDASSGGNGPLLS